MSDPLFQFQFMGENKSESANSFAQYVNSLFDTSAVPTGQQQSSDSADSKTDPVALAAFVISIPSAILAAMDIVDRIKKKKKLDELLNKMRQLEKTQKTTIRLISPKGEVLEISQISSGKMLDMAETANK